MFKFIALKIINAAMDNFTESEELQIITQIHVIKRKEEQREMKARIAVIRKSFYQGYDYDLEVLQLHNFIEQ